MSDDDTSNSSDNSDQAFENGFNCVSLVNNPKWNNFFLAPWTDTPKTAWIMICFTTSICVFSQRFTY